MLSSILLSYLKREVIYQLCFSGAKFYADNFAVWFIFATNWGFLLLAVSAVLRALAAMWYFFEFRSLGELGDCIWSMSFYLCHEVMFCFCFSSVFVVTAKVIF